MWVVQECLCRRMVNIRVCTAQNWVMLPPGIWYIDSIFSLITGDNTLLHKATIQRFFVYQFLIFCIERLSYF